MNEFLDIIEKRLKFLFEDSFNLFIKFDKAHTLAKRIPLLIKQNLVNDQFGNIIAPDIIKITIRSGEQESWRDAQEFLSNIAKEICQAGEELGYKFTAYPRIIIISSETINQDDYELEVEFTSITEVIEQTSVFAIAELTQPKSQIPQNAFLIVNGKQSYPLDKSLIYVGRRSTSDIQIEDPQISRDHLQLRAHDGRFIIFDLDSTGGTLINGKRIKSAFLFPGDVITIGSSHLIYTQDMTDGYSSTTKLEIEN